MPVTPTYPGVYIEEIPSGVRTITGVATSITAFIGRALQGPVSEPVTINSFGDFERMYGGLWVDAPISYAVRDFYRNGGSQAIIVRLFKAPQGGTGIAQMTVGGLKLEAANPGKWGNNLEATVDYEGIDDEVAARYGLTKDQLFNLTVVERAPDGSAAATERHRNLSVEEGPRRVDRVLEQESVLVRVQRKADGSPDLPAAIPTETSPPPANGDGGDANGNGGNGDGDGGNADGGNGNGNGNPDGGAIKATGGADSTPLDQAAYEGSKDDKTGLFALDKADLFNLLCIPPDRRDADTLPAVYQTAMQYCVDRRAMLVVDSPAAWGKKKETAAAEAKKGLPALGLSGVAARNAALYFPRVRQPDPLREGQPDTFVPCGIIAGVMARTDVQRGVWKAPAGLDAAINGIQGLEVNLTDEENGMLNPLGINCLRAFPISGRVVWGARTLRGADQLADEYKYVPVRRLALFIEESLYRGTQWVVFEPNDEPLWAQIRLNVGAFMHNLFRQGAFQGTSPRQAYFVKCDKETTTQNDINLGIVNILVGFAPLKPAEFVIIKIQQMAGQIET
jgi:phage tail sheath protein FI